MAAEWDVGENAQTHKNPQKLTAQTWDGRVWSENWALTAGVRVPKFCCCHGVIVRG